MIGKFEERFTSARELAESRLFRFGITDTAIYEAAKDVLILTTDGRLAKLINDLGTLAVDLATFSVLE